MLHKKDIGYHGNLWYIYIYLITWLKPCVLNPVRYITFHLLLPVLVDIADIALHTENFHPPDLLARRRQ